MTAMREMGSKCNYMPYNRVAETGLMAWNVNNTPKMVVKVISFITYVVLVIELTP